MTRAREYGCGKYEGTGQFSDGERPSMHELGKNPGDVLRINTQPFPEAHFAVFPEALVKPLIKSSCPNQICSKCGFIRERIIEKSTTWQERKEAGASGGSKTEGHNTTHGDGVSHDLYYNGKTIGFTKCNCNEPFEPGTVLDIFAGSGTSLLVARKMDLNYIGFEINPEYVKITNERLEKVVTIEQSFEREEDVW